MPNLKVFFQAVYVCDSIKRAGAKLNKGVSDKSNLIKWSQDWSLDLWDQVVQEVERGEVGC
jgi:hypothetical protein